MPPLIVANWKCNPTTLEGAKELFSDYGKLIDKKDNVVVCPPFVYLTEVLPRGHEGGFSIGAQDCFYEEKGAYTGEISSLMLKDLGCQYVIIGHSERRKYFSETDETINKKIKTALSAGLTPIFCVGETEGQRNGGEAESVVRQQLAEGLREISNFKLKISNLVVAYEPVWAIGTGKACGPEDARKMLEFIKKEIKEPIRVLYGGSVNGKNAAGYIKEAGFQGLLVGGASLDAEEFAKIAQSAV